ncbi:MAG: DUF2062 domain-containing protein [Proteobacteria bacterium]|nr:DUF2062 domain-containing protein [Pseudomonadota bacterium]
MLRQKLQRWLPTPEKVRANRWLRWLGPLLERRWLWRLDRKSVSLGAAIGVFFGFLVPVAQIFLSALFVLLLRGNLPVAVVSTLVSNPFTYVPIAVLAYRTGSAMLGHDLDAAKAAAFEKEVDAAQADPEGWVARVAEIGAPLFLGLATFAVCGATITWTLVYFAWTLIVHWQRRRRRRRPSKGSGN